MTAKRSTPERGFTHSALPLFIITLARNQKALDIFKLTTLCNIVIKAEAYRPKMGLHSATVISILATSGALQAASSLPVVWGSSVPTCCNCDLQDEEVPHPASCRGCSHAKQGLHRRRNLRTKTLGSGERTFFSKYITPDRSFATPICSIGSNQQKQQQSSGKITHHDTKHEISQCRITM
jgi:hypothetical protein